MEFSGLLEYDKPSENLDKWDGALTYNGQTKSAGIDNLLLRGCKLKNIKVAYGVVIYVGKHTKVMMNAKKPPVKVS
jgi:phospholipid-transporting ATPase